MRNFFKEKFGKDDDESKVPKPDRGKEGRFSWREKLGQIREGAQATGRAEIDEIKKIARKMPQDPVARELLEKASAINEEFATRMAEETAECKAKIQKIADDSGENETQEKNKEESPADWGKTENLEEGASQSEKIGKTEERELQEGVKKLDIYIEKAEKELEDLGVPVRGLRIDMEKYNDVVNDLTGDRNYLQEMEAKFAADDAKRGIKEGDIILGEQMERFSTALLYKIFKELGMNYIAVRTSRCDDIRHKIDSVIFDTKNGRIIGTVDMVVSQEGRERFEDKRKHTFASNARRGGGKLDYGLDVKDGKIIKAKRKNVPVACINLPAGDFKTILKEVDLCGSGLSEKERRLGIQFLNSLKEQFSYFEDEEYKGTVQELDKMIGLLDYTKEKSENQSNIQQKGDVWTWK